MSRDIITTLRAVLLLVLLLGSLAYWRVFIQSWSHRDRCTHSQIALNSHTEPVSLDGYLQLEWLARYRQGLFLTPVTIPLPWRPIQLTNNSSPPFHLVLNEGRAQKRKTNLANAPISLNSSVSTEPRPPLERSFDEQAFHFGKVLLHEYLFFLDVNGTSF
jgi:hypothetical protein